MPADRPMPADAERERLRQDGRREANWQRWGPYLAERQWGTVREDYSADGSAWDYFTHDQARSRVYRWGEDGLCGITDRECRLCFALALWNERDPFLKERLFGLGGHEGNHGEDVKESYFYLDNVPTHSWMRVLYQYPQAAFPYGPLVAENRRRGVQEPEYELTDTGVFADGRWFDVQVDYAKRDPDDLLVRITVKNCGPEAATLHVLPQLWFRNTWSWGRSGEDYQPRPSLGAGGVRRIDAEHGTLGRFVLELDDVDGFVGMLFTENESNLARLFGGDNPQPYLKDAFSRCVVDGARDAVNPALIGTKAALHCRLTVPAGGEVQLRLRLRAEELAGTPAFADFDAVMRQRQGEADAFYRGLGAAQLDAEAARVQRQAYAGLLWNKQFYFYDVRTWLAGDPTQPPPPALRAQGRNSRWRHLYNRDIVSMPDKWEYPWYAAWDLAFHMLPMARLDPEFAKAQLLLLLREWYMRPDGQLPAYEYAFDDVNPPVHAWAVWRVYKLTGARGARDRTFLARAFHKLLLNFTWWVNRKDHDGNHVFGGGFLGLDNIGVFDRGAPLPGGAVLEQADGTAWMAFYCSTMLSMALELARADRSYEDVASKFFEHFVAITSAMNTLGGDGLWDETDGFYYDQFHHAGRTEKLRVRSMVGVIPLFAVEVLDGELLAQLPGFQKRMQWFLRHERDLAHRIQVGGEGSGKVLLSAAPLDRLVRVLGYVLDERELLSPFGVRSLSKAHREQPFELRIDGHTHRVDYAPGESTTGMFGGNSNWRGPVWFPLNYLLLEALQRFHHFYGDEVEVECPVGSGVRLDLRAVADLLVTRLTSLFRRGDGPAPPFAGRDARFAADPSFRERLLFHEYFNGDTGAGLGASHQTGWTALVARCLEARTRREPRG